MGGTFGHIGPGGIDGRRVLLRSTAVGWGSNAKGRPVKPTGS